MASVILYIIFGMLAFRVVYYLLDAYHDNWMLKEKDYALKAEGYRSMYGNTPHSDYLEELSRTYSRRWHMIDAWIKGLVEGSIALFAVAPVLYITNGHFIFSWWYVILPLSGGLFRWLWFDACWNWVRGLSFWYRGSVASSELPGLKKWVFFTLKFGLNGIMIGIIIYYYLKCYNAL